MRRLAGATLTAALILAFTQSATAEIRILASTGGTVGSYLDFFARVKRSGERVVIVGPCLSACTLVLSTIPRKRICGTREPCSASMRLISSTRTDGR
jgi:hypothetical protein